MMRLGRRATLLVALFLFASAATPSAECAAWVLGGQLLDDSSGGGRQVLALALESYTDKAACEAEKVARRTNQAKAVFVCLPDTMDLRGPKGK